MQAVIGRYLLANLDENIRIRRRNAQILIDEFQGSKIASALLDFPPVDTFDSDGASRSTGACYKVYGYIGLHVLAKMGKTVAELAQHVESIARLKQKVKQ